MIRNQKKGGDQKTRRISKLVYSSYTKIKGGVFMRKLTILTILVFSFTLLTLTAFAGEPITLRFNLGTEPPTIDPALASDTTSVNVIEQLFLGLTDYDDNTMEVIPELATKWKVSSDGLVWTFYMRKDVKWTDGHPVTAHDIEYGVKRTLDPKTASDYAYVLYIIKGAEAFNTGKGSADDVGVKAIDDYTVQFTLTTPAGYFPAIAGMWVARPQPKWVIEKYGDKWTDPKNIVTNGPYKLVEWKHEDHMVLVKNPDYFDAKNVQIEKVMFYMVQEESTAMAMYENGELDTVGVPLEDMDRVKKDPVLSKELYIAPYLCTYYYGFNASKPPFDNPLVRKAFSAAIDRKTLVERITKGGQKPAYTFVCPGIFGHVPPEKGIGIRFNPEQAKKWLAEAGYPNGEGFPEVVLMFNTSEGHAKIAQAIQAMWKKYLNVNVKLTNQEWKVYLKTLRSNPDAYNIYRLGWCADYPDANNWLNEVFNSKSPQNHTHWKNEFYDQLVEKAARIQDPKIRKQLYEQAEYILCEQDAAIAPIYWYTTVNLTKPYLKRTYAPMGGEHIKDWRIEK